VRPGAEAEVFEVLAGSEGPGGSDQAAGVVREVELGEFSGELEGAVEGACCCLGSLGRVLGDVRGDRAFGQLLAVVEVGGTDRADVELAAEGEGVGAVVEGGAVDVGFGSSGSDGVGEEVRGGPGWGRGVVGAVEADDRVEMDGASLLVLGDLGEGDAGVVAEPALGEARALGDFSAEVGGEATPEETGVGVPEDGRFVVVRVRVERGAEGVVVLVVAGAAAARAVVSTAVVDRAEAGGGEGGEDSGVGVDVRRGALAASQASGDQVEGVAAVGLGAGRAAGDSAVVAADEELAGGEGGGVEVAEDGADLAGGGVEVVLGAVAVQADGVGAAAEGGELLGYGGEGAGRGQGGEFRQRGRGGAGEDGPSPSGLLWSGVGGPGAAGCLAVSWPPQGFEQGVRSAAVVVAEQGAQDYGGYRDGDRRDGDGRQERGEDYAAGEDGDHGAGADRDGGEGGGASCRGRGHRGLRGRRGGVVGVLGEEHRAPLIYSSRCVSRL